MLKLSSFCLALILSLALAHEPAPSLRGTAVDTISSSSYQEENESVDTDHPYLLERQGRRHLQVGGMQPLSCNENFSPCVPWSVFAGRLDRHSSTVIIPCGQCVTMDHAGERLILSGGLDIRGKLVFPNTYRGLTLLSTMIVVQGVLEMRYVGRISGTPAVKFVMIGNGVRTFEPIDVNTRYCGTLRCVAGKKAITVAGGRVNLRGISVGTKTWVKLHDVTGISAIETIGLVVPAAGVLNRWGVGAEILVTSHTNQGDDQQVRRIAGYDTNYDETGYVRLFLDEPVRRPTTYLDDDRGFAVEVALLSRHIVFEGGPDDTSFHGGHFWIFETPEQNQQVIGVEVVNFGQAGELGRYPIHAHLSGDLSGSVIAQNTIRDSNQRCVVIHATDNVRIEDNVAYNTAGHCFMLEDGIEFGNRFVRNLGAQTKRPGRLIPNNGETDSQPSTFWIPSLGNSWIGNVAAGCVQEGSNCSGFWFEPLLRGPLAGNYPDLSPHAVNIVSFEGNSAHSNSIGMKTYPDAGLRPVTTPNVLFEFAAYRNRFKGLFVFFASNLIIEGGIFADNSVNIEIDQSLAVQVLDAQIIGETELYAEQMESQRFFHTCQADMIVGLQLNTDAGRTGVTIAPSVTFSGFQSSRCGAEVPVMLDTDELPIEDLQDLVGGGGNGVLHSLGDLPNGLFINCGGFDVFQNGAFEWDIDKYFQNGEPGLVHDDGRPAIVNYYREQAGRTLDYVIPVNDGTYSVTLYWSEYEYNSRNAREFDVFLNGDVVLRDFDVFDTVGRRGGLTRREFHAIVTNDEELNITLEGTRGNAFLSAYIIRPVRD